MNKQRKWKEKENDGVENDTHGILHYIIKCFNKSNYFTSFCFVKCHVMTCYVVSCNVMTCYDTQYDMLHLATEFISRTLVKRTFHS